MKVSQEIKQEANQYVDEVFQKLQVQNPNETEFLQAVEEFLPAAKLFFAKNPHLLEKNIFGQLVEPERLISFRVPWVDDQQQVQVNRGYRVQFNSALGPYKGGLRFHPTVNASVLKFLAFEQIFKNSLTQLMIGGGKGGADFDPKGKSDGEIMRFCQSFMLELQRHIGENFDVPAGDIGVGAREIGYLFGMYKKLNGMDFGVLTGKPLLYGGSPGRTEATGYGLVYFVENLLKDLHEDFSQHTVHVSGSGNVAIYAIEKALALGAKVLTCSDSDGVIYDPAGIDVTLLKEIKEIKRQRLTAYQKNRPDAQYFSKKSVWDLPFDFTIALPCATQNEISLSQAQNMVDHGLKIIVEGANMPTAISAVAFFAQENIYYCPGKAANAGGVAVSALEMAQDSQRMIWNIEKVDQELSAIMKNIYQTCRDTANAYDCPNNFLMGSNLASLEKVAFAMDSQGIV
ncbi:NADP-specific glutamate dehydrogenase [Enterococcus timonensis]|uniref:NADP-specific glutamate dehydrogenase n=1 Tax=Enterococcus timonensis TaxID=1852364 RepID=UPI0008D99823|nr:NADP-specific glutamate dehydrogenase [Enterococcus timonensis]